MVRLQLVMYWKRYLRKGRYRCKRYFFYVPVSVGEQIDRSVDYQEKFNLLQFIFSQFGNYSSVIWKYSQGGGAWNLLTITDGTSGLTQNGTITFTPPSDWKYDTINNVQNRFWVRVQAAGVTAAAHINQVLMNPCYLGILLDPLFTLDATIWDQTNYELTFQQQENPA